MKNFKVVVKAAYADRFRETYYVEAIDADDAAERYTEASPQQVEALKYEGGDMLWSDVESITEVSEGGGEP